jgi:hypothetical protein
MDQSEDDRDLERKIQQASRIASTITDQTTIETAQELGGATDADLEATFGRAAGQ